MAGSARAIAGRYTLVREVGRGGMGAVWLARDEVLGRAVAVKRIGLFPGGSSPDLLRAQREATLAARLNHPHVVSVFDFVSEGDEQWLVMEHVEGTNLSSLAQRRGGLPPEQAAAIVGQAAEALAAAHAAGIVHRDVKPSNILVDDAGRAKLADFGIARARADSSLTASGSVVGSPAYLAPEVARGDKATEASDVWSLGATLYQALTGRPPYDVEDNVLAAMYRIVNEPPPRLPDLPWPADLLETTMTPDPGARWSMARVRDYLGRGAAGPPQAPPAAERTAVLPVAAGRPAAAAREDSSDAPEPPEPRDRSRRAPLLMSLLAVVLVVAAAAGWALLREEGDPTRAREPAGTTTVESPSPPRDPAAGQTPSPDRSPTAPAPTQANEPTPEPPRGRVAEMRSFVEHYVATAVSEPATAWTMLTPRFQQEIGGYDSYAGFWNTIESATLRDIEVHPSSMEVGYTITWRPEGRSPEDERVVLGLVEQDGQYLIDTER